MASSQLLADLLQGYSTGKKTGALYVAVAEQSENLIRFYFDQGSIYGMSYGPIKGRECLDILDCYNLGKVVYFDGFKMPSASTDLPGTEDIIDMIRMNGKQVQAS